MCSFEINPLILIQLQYTIETFQKKLPHRRYTRYIYKKHYLRGGKKGEIE